MNPADQLRSLPVPDGAAAGLPGTSWLTARGIAVRRWRWVLEEEADPRPPASRSRSL